MSPPKPHISPALVSLGGWVTASGAIVIACALMQLCVFGMIRYTDLRVTRLEGQPNDAVVAPRESAEAEIETTPAPVVASSKKSAHKAARPHEAVDPNKVASVADRNMDLASTFSSAAGLVGAFLLAVLSSLGVIIAAGASVPGVHQGVRACVFSITALLLSFPWSGAAGASMIPGVFCGYGCLISGAEGGGGVPMFMTFVLLPLGVMGLAGSSVMLFRRGVQAGIILTSLSEVDEALEREMAIVRQRGVGRLTPGQARTAGALSHTLTDERLAAVDDPPPLRRAVGAESMSPSLDPAMKRRRSGDFDPSSKRPI